MLKSALVLMAYAPGVFMLGVAMGQKPQQQHSRKPVARSTARVRIPDEIMLRILRAEDARRWDVTLGSLLLDRNPRVRQRAALATGRIGDERALSSLITLLQTDRDASVRAMAAFALGQVGSAAGADALVSALRRGETSEVRARAIEAVGKIAAALPKTDEERARDLGGQIINALASASQEDLKQNRQLILLGLTAVLRARPASASSTVAQFLSSGDARIRADAANTLARLRAKDANDQLRVLLTNDTDAVVRANAARALGAAEDQAALDALVDRSTNDADERVRVSAIRALGSLKDTGSATPLLQRAVLLFVRYRTLKNGADRIEHPSETNELLEIATALGLVLANTGDARAVAWLREFREAEEEAAPEIEIAFARIAPAAYLREWPFNKLTDTTALAKLRKNWRVMSSLAQGLGAISGLTALAAGNSVIGMRADAQIILRELLDDPGTPALAQPDVLRALASFKGNDLGEVLRKQLSSADVIVRATAAELLNDLPPDETNTRALAEALPAAMRDEMNDAALAILDVLAKQKGPTANNAIKTALGSADHLIRRRAVMLLRANGASDYQSSNGGVATRHTVSDYQRAIARRGRLIRATVSTDKGSFTIELLPEDAPLTVDNFIQLAGRGFFNGITFHRVVPNFVIQGGDPRGDGNGGPGYQIRCEINEVPYDRGAVGMALSGKDTGGSQWFVTHSPQPHLDGGYTVFGRVLTADMHVVDGIARGDQIRSVSVTEVPRSASKEGNRAPALRR